MVFPVPTLVPLSGAQRLARETGAIGDLRNRVAVIDSSLRTLKDVELPTEN